jgi:ectoine hydroxylase-related dioxygenase (phytanoyl-CoA dioxygenase family)
VTGSPLPADALARYHEDGVLFPIRVLSDEQVRGYRRACDELLNALGSVRPRDHISQWHLCFRWAYDLAVEPAVLDAVESVLGPNILVHSSTMFFKPPDGQLFVPWHQDGHYWRMDTLHLTSAWIALTESNRTNGCLRVARGSHHADRIGHRVRADAASLLSGLELAVPVDERQAVDVCLAPGEMSLHHLNAVHGSEPNRGDEPRIGFAVRYAAAGVHQERVHHEVVLARGEDRSGAFRHLSHPPPDALADGLEAQRQVVAWIRANITPRTT